MSTLALDVDGVLFDYHEGYRRMWERTFGGPVQEVQPLAHLPRERFGVPFLADPQERNRLRQAMKSEFWGTLPALPGALEACQWLVSHGHTLVCVSALEEEHKDVRVRNLLDLGFPITEVHCVGPDHPADGRSPKADVLNRLMPRAFVDDHAPYLRGVDPGIHRALIAVRPMGSPNVGRDLSLASSTHSDLLDFAKRWCAGEWA
jgi:phosphoglycolate phosphatase-like HAD superfamily hydrolase